MARPAAALCAQAYRWRALPRLAAVVTRLKRGVGDMHVAAGASPYTKMCWDDIPVPWPCCARAISAWVPTTVQLHWQTVSTASGAPGSGLGVGAAHKH
jgi:hypothetical protein